MLAQMTSYRTRRAQLASRRWRAEAAAFPEVSPLPAQTSPSTNATPPGTGATSRASVASSNVLTDVLQSGGKFDPTQFDFSVLTLPNTHKANRKKKEGDKAAAGNKNSSIL